MRAWAWAVLLAAGLGAAPGSAANLVEVRVGRHAEFTRVVLETDAPTRYELVGEAEGELRVRLFASAAPRRLASKSSVLREVVIESDAAGAMARLALAKSGSVDVKEMVLDHPPRIVLDLIPRTAVARAPVTVTAKKGPAPALAKAEPAPPPAPAAEPAPVPAAKSAASPPAEKTEAPSPPVAEARPAPLEDPESRAEAAPEAPSDEAERAARDAAAQAELDRLAGVAPPPEPRPQPAAPPAAEEAPESPSAAGTEGAAEGRGAAGEADEGAAGFEDDEGYDAEAAEVAAMPSQPRVPAPGPLGFLPQPFDDPLVLSVVLVLLGLIGLLVVIRQRAARSAEAEASANPFAAADAFAFAGSGASRAPGEASASGAAVPDPALGPLFANAAQRGAEAPAASIFDVAEEDAGRYEECTPPASALVVVDSDEAAQGTPSSEALEEKNVMRVVEELERRIAHLETRLEEVADAKERLERHVAAQTEELRVQRAAIARTQRVLRTIAKPEDLATEPTPKV